MDEQSALGRLYGKGRSGFLGLVLANRALVGLCTIGGGKAGAIGLIVMLAMMLAVMLGVIRVDVEKRRRSDGQEITGRDEKVRRSTLPQHVGSL